MNEAKAAYISHIQPTTVVLSYSRDLLHTYIINQYLRCEMCTKKVQPGLNGKLNTVNASGGVTLFPRKNFVTDHFGMFHRCININIHCIFNYFSWLFRIEQTCQLTVINCPSRQRIDYVSKSTILKQPLLIIGSNCIQNWAISHSSTGKSIDIFPHGLWFIRLLKKIILCRLYVFIVKCILILRYFLRVFLLFLDIINHQIYLIENIDAALYVCIELIKNYVSSNNYTYQVPVTWFTNIQLSAPLRQFVLFFLSRFFSFRTE